jgi:hypothetical protein
MVLSDNPIFQQSKWMNHIKIGIENTRTLRDNIHRGLKEFYRKKHLMVCFIRYSMELPELV